MHIFTLHKKIIDVWSVYMNIEGKGNKSMNNVNDLYRTIKRENSTAVSLNHLQTQVAAVKERTILSFLISPAKRLLDSQFADGRPFRPAGGGSHHRPACHQPTACRGLPSPSHRLITSPHCQLYQQLPVT